MNWKTIVKYFLGVSAIPMVVGFFLLFTGAVDSNQQETNQADLEINPVFFGTNYVPNFVGSSVKDAVLMLENEFEAEFNEILNLDNKEEIRTFFYDEDDFEKVEGLFVCSQNAAPGADPHDSIITLYLQIEVSAGCEGKVADLHMGPSAQALGVWSPLPFNGKCSFQLRDCEDTREVDAIFLRFLDEDSYDGIKTALVRTGIGEVEAKLAWIDPANQWCGFNRAGNEDLIDGAIAARNQLLSTGQKIRLIREDSWSDEWFFHRLTDEGELQDGPIPELSVSEQLVQSGFWVPDEDEINHSYEHYYQDIRARSWVIRSSNSSENDSLLFQYAERIAAAANSAFAEPNEYLATCIDEKQEDLESLSGYVATNDDGDDDRRNYVRVPSKKDSEEDWELNCDGDSYYDSPQLCDGGERLLREFYEEIENNPDRYPGGDNDYSGGGSNCTYVDGYTKRDGTRVRGHWRCR